MNNDTQHSPGIGDLDPKFSAYGGILVDIVGTNDQRMTCQISPSGLFKGNISTSETFKLITAISGFDPTLFRLGGGIKKCNIRVTLSDGDSGSPTPLYSSVFYLSTPGDRMPFGGRNCIDPAGAGFVGLTPYQPDGYDFDGGQDLYVAIDLGGGTYINCGYMGETKTFQLKPDGTTDYYWRDQSLAPGGGAHDRSYTGFPGQFALQQDYNSDYGTPMILQNGYWVSNPSYVLLWGRRNALPAVYRNFFAVTGWFAVPDTQLTALANYLKSAGQMNIGIHDKDPGDQYYDFTQGVGGNVSTIPMFPPAVLSFTATPAAAVGSTQVTLAWTTQNCTSVAIDHGVTATAANGTAVVTVNATTTFTIVATGVDGVADPVSVTVPWSRPVLGITSFVASPATLAGPGHTQLQWVVSNADAIVITGPRGFSFTVPPESLLNGSHNSLDLLQEETDTYTLTASQTGGGSVVRTATVSLDAPPLVIVSAALLPAADTLNRTYSFQLVGTGGLGSYSWASAGVPAGLTLSAGGLLSGTLAAGSSQTFSIPVTLTGAGVTDSAVRVFTLPFTRVPLAITTTQTDLDHNPARELVPYQFQFLSQYGGPTKTWSIVAGHLPPGMALAPATGILSGTSNSTPIGYGYWRFTVQVADGAEIATCAYELKVQLGWARLDPFHEIFYRVFTTDNEPVMGLDGKLLTNDPSPDGPGKVPFAEVVVAFEVGTGDFSVKDARVQGGGLAPQFQTIEDARNFFDLGYWDGKPYPIGGGMAIYLPQALLARMTREEVNAKLNAILPLGTLPVVRYYDNTGEESL